MVSAEIAQNQKWHFFFEKVFFFLTWLKKWVLLTVFLKSCVFLKALFYSVFSKTQLFENQNCMLRKKQNFLWKNSGLFLKVAKWCFGVCFFFQVFMLLWFVFGVSGTVPKLLKCLSFFSQFFWGFCGVAYSCLFGFRRFRCFCVSCVCFSVLCCFCFCFVCFVFVLLLDCFGCWFLFCFVLFFVLFVCFCFSFLFFWEGLRVRWGGPKGHLTWLQTLLIFFLFCFFSLPSFLCFF